VSAARLDVPDHGQQLIGEVVSASFDGCNTRGSGLLQARILHKPDSPLSAAADMLLSLCRKFAIGRDHRHSVANRQRSELIGFVEE
jgi:hypothetical protein